MLRAEAMLDHWAVPNLTERPTERLYSVEVLWDLAPGLLVAGRIGHIDFRPLNDGLTAASPNGPLDWDDDVTRYEVSLGYRLARNAGILLSAFEQIQSNEVDTDRQIQSTEVDIDSRFFGIRLWWAF